MSLHPEGLGYFVHKIKDTENGSPAAAASLARKSGVDHILVKILDGPWKYNQRPYYEKGILKYADDIIRPFVRAFQDAGVRVWGWGWVYLEDPAAEARAAIARVEDLALDGYVINAEADAKNEPAEAKIYADILKAATFPVGLSSYRYPVKYHMDLPWSQLLSACDFALPQVYWIQAHNPAYQLAQTFDQYNALFSRLKMEPLPVIPTGAAFTEWGWTATKGDVLAFLDAAQKSGVSSVNFWEWNHARRLGLWEVIEGYGWPWPPAQTPPPPARVPVDTFVVDHVYPWMRDAGYSGPAPAA